MNINFVNFAPLRQPYHNKMASNNSDSSDNVEKILLEERDIQAAELPRRKEANFWTFFLPSGNEPHISLLSLLLDLHF